MKFKNYRPFYTSLILIRVAQIGVLVLPSYSPEDGSFFYWWYERIVNQHWVCNLVVIVWLNIPATLPALIRNFLVVRMSIVRSLNTVLYEKSRWIKSLPFPLYLPILSPLILNEHHLVLIDMLVARLYVALTVLDLDLDGWALTMVLAVVQLMPLRRAHLLVSEFLFGLIEFLAILRWLFGFLFIVWGWVWRNRFYFEE